MKRPRIEGYAIISREGMIAASDGHFPEHLKNPADHAFYMASLDKASAIANGRHSAEGGEKEKLRRRLLLTRRITMPTVDPANPNVLLWNPGGTTFDEAWQHMRIDGGVLAVVGGTDVFGLFLAIGYDAFYLTRTEASVPRGRAVFPGVGTRGTTPEEIMQKNSLVLRGTRMLDEAVNCRVEEWGPKA
jgi:dihydrofolate reductase